MWRGADAGRLGDVIEINDLTKRYGAMVAVEDVSFSCRPGTVTGFLGANGAGKSTTLRMLTGLTPATGGTARVAGVAYRALVRPGRVVGVMLDATAQHPGRTGRETLRLVAAALGVPRAWADEQLERVDLGHAAGKRVATYSLGMRQRLGIAAALVGDPAALVLDEPANGLDPAGIAWMRHLLRGFADGGGTVLLSSHLLREVEATADQLVVIGAGRILAQGLRTELLAGAGAATEVRAEKSAELGRALDEADLGWRAAADGSIRVEASTEVVARIAGGAGVVPTMLRPLEGEGLEDWFLTLTGGRS